MIPENVTLIVKAPNQQIEDQNIECQSSWTVRQLKGHLSNVYPSKPKTEEQKIIYSGQLLQDDSVLKDVLRRYDDDIPHTMHLVCTQPPPVQSILQNDGLRARTSVTNSTATITAERRETNRPETRQNDQNHTVEMANYLSSMGYNSGPAYLAGAPEPNMLAMHHAYLHYMQRYAHQWQEAAVAAAPAPPPPQAPPAAPPVEEEERRDWLDHIYTASRLAILFSLVYLYGSPARLLLVVLLATAGYLHQIGFFRDLQVNAPDAVRQRPNVQNANANVNNANANVNNANANVNNANANLNNANANLNNANANLNNANANVNNANANINQAYGDHASENVNNANTNAAQAFNDNQQSLLAVTWMIFSTFFSSLIPDTNQ